jgi:hypothetical protein
MCLSGKICSATGLKLYVSTEGNDSWSGKLRQPDRYGTDGPFASVERARDAIRTLKETKKLPQGEIIVEILEGVYLIPETIRFESVDGGSGPDSDIIYSGEKGKEVRLVGGMNLKKWDKVSDPLILEKLRPEIRDRIYQADLRDIGMNDFGSPEGGGAELFFNGEPMFISRYPNKDFLKITGLFNEEPFDIRGTKGDKTGKFSYDNRRISNWSHEPDAWLHGYWFWDWSEQRHKIASIDTFKGIIEVEKPYHEYGYRTGQWFYGFNLLSEIDVPGEYYIDREKGILYFYPSSDPEQGQSYVSLTGTLVDIRKASFLTIRGLTLEACRETAIVMTDCSNSAVAGCTIRNTGNWGVVISGGRRNGVRGCIIYNTGAGGIDIHAGERKTLIPGECVAENNHIHHVARLKRAYNPGILISGVGNRIGNNLIEQLPHMAIGFSGNDHLIEFNEISNVCYESNDAGAVYAGRNWTMRGNMIRHNFLHDISGFEGKGCVGIYLDDAFSSADVIGNVFKDVTRAMMIGGGRDNKVINNIFIDCVPSLHIDARGLGWMENSFIPEWLDEAQENGTIMGIAFNRPPYSTRYPELANMLNDKPKAPEGNLVTLNICKGGNWDKPAGLWEMSIEKNARKYLIMRDNIVSEDSDVEDRFSQSIIIADPLFVNSRDPESGQFRLRNNSPALKLGFKQIPFENIGILPGNGREYLYIQN